MGAKGSPRPLTALDYPRIHRKYPITDEEIDGLIGLLEGEALVVAGEAETDGAIPSDPQDEMALACAVEGLADLIVSGDRCLLQLEEYQGIHIITVRELLERLTIEPESQAT